MASQPEPPGLNLLPWPRSVDTGAGALTMTEPSFVPAEADGPSPRVQAAVAELSRIARLCTGLPAGGASPVEIRIRSGQRSAAAAGEPGHGVPGIIEDESYWLVVDDAGIFVDAATEWGVLRGLVTLGQLLRADGTIPHVAIDDRPAFPWRGLLLDPARHFLPVAAILRTLDGMARCKMNVLHLHLTDDQGFRFAVPGYPALASADHYSDKDLSRVIAHAAGLGIRVVPEVDMPGHVTSWLTAYPEWGARQVGPTERFGVHGACLDPTSEAVYAAIGSILDRLVAVFPDPCLHIGGDEVSPRWWSADPNVQSLMEREGLADLRAVQGYFNQRVGRMAAERGRQVVAWDEVLAAGHGEDWIIQAWRGVTMRDRALACGNRVLLSAPYYLDLFYPTDVLYGFDPAASQEDLVAREDALLADPRFSHVADGIRWTGQWREGALERPGAAEKVPPGSDPRILGGEACLWGELVDDRVLDCRLWSRLPSVAERFWSNRTLSAGESIHRRQDWFVDTALPLAGIDLAAACREHWRRLGISERWAELVSMLEPVKWYGRLLGAEALAARISGEEMPQARPYDLRSSLDELIDQLPPESRQARRLAEMCLAAGAGDDVARSRLQVMFRRWREVAHAASDAPLDLAGPAARLGMLADAIDARLGAGTLLSPENVQALLEPAGARQEYVLAMPPELHGWLTGR